MKCNSLKSYLSFRQKCPFCKKPLINKVETFLRTDRFSVRPFPTIDNILKFDLTINKLYPLRNYSVVKVTLFDLLKVGYRVKSAYEQEKELPKEEFIKIFNDSHLNIISSCSNKCEYNYFTTSLPLRMNERGITEYVLYTESVNYKKFIIHNNFIDNKLKIYLDNSTAPPIETDLYNLNVDTAMKFLTRIKVALTFS